MLSVGLTGGIGSGKSTVAQRFRELGALVIDADQLAREVVATGSAGLRAIHERFGETVLAVDGSLDRGALGAIVFADPQARADLEAITHPLIRARTRSLRASAAPGRIVVDDIPLLVEKRLGPTYHLTVVVGADQDVRIARLMSGGRGVSEPDARSRIAAQASDEQRRAAADAWLDNSGSPAELLAQVDALWWDRLVGFNDNLRSGARSPRPEVPALVPYDDSWPDAADRLIARITLALGGGAPGGGALAGGALAGSALSGAGNGDARVSVEHIGSTSVPGLAAKDVIDLQIAVPTLADADLPQFVKALAAKGFPRSEGNVEDTVHSWAPHQSCWLKRFHGSADPGRLAHVHVREHGSAGWESAILFREWLVANPAERDAYAGLKAALARVRPQTSTVAITGSRLDAYTAAKEPWIDGALERARLWARATGWTAR